jgi:hypothetical protein
LIRVQDPYKQPFLDRYSIPKVKVASGGTMDNQASGIWSEGIRSDKKIMKQQRPIQGTATRTIDATVLEAAGSNQRSPQ